MTWDWSYAWSILPVLLEAFWVTVRATVLSALIALVLGAVVAVIRTRRIPVLTPLITFMIDFIRGTPFLIQLFVIFFALPAYGINMSPFASGVLALGINYTAYMAEVYRAGVESVPKGQWDAVSVLGIPRFVLWFKVILPQALRPIGPVLGNYVIVMFKESVLLSVITVPELMTMALWEANNSYRYLEPITLVGLLFWMVSYPLARGVRYWERRVSVSYE